MKYGKLYEIKTTTVIMNLQSFLTPEGYMGTRKSLKLSSSLTKWALAQLPSPPFLVRGLHGTCRLGLSFTLVMDMPKTCNKAAKVTTRTLVLNKGVHPGCGLDQKWPKVINVPDDPSVEGASVVALQDRPALERPLWLTKSGSSLGVQG